MELYLPISKCFKLLTNKVFSHLPDFLQFVLKFVKRDQHRINTATGSGSHFVEIYLTLILD